MTDLAIEMPLPRKRGRPKGSRNTPKTLGEFIVRCLKDPYPPPPKSPNEPKGGGRGIWSKLKTPEERSAYAKWLRSHVSLEGLSRTGRKPGTPNGWTAESIAEADERAKREVKRLAKELEATGALPSDPIAREAALTCLEILRSPVSRNLRLKCARTLLEYFEPRPSAAKPKLPTAEEWLAELAASEEADTACAESGS